MLRDSQACSRDSRQSSVRKAANGGWPWMSIMSSARMLDPLSLGRSRPLKTQPSMNSENVSCEFTCCVFSFNSQRSSQRFPKYPEIVTLTLFGDSKRGGQVLEVRGWRVIGRGSYWCLRERSLTLKKHTTCEFTGDIFRISAISEDMLGRAFNGCGRLRDKGPNILLS